MQLSKLTTWFVAGYLVLLLNLGPSLHRAEFLGLHGCCDSHHSVHRVEQSCGCCAHNATETPPFDGDQASWSPHHDCSFCKFFDQFHVVIATFMIEPEVNQSPVDTLIKPNVSPALSFQPLARGPPITS